MLRRWLRVAVNSGIVVPADNTGLCNPHNQHTIDQLCSLSRTELFYVDVTIPRSRCSTIHLACEWLEVHHFVSVAVNGHILAPAANLARPRILRHPADIH